MKTYVAASIVVFFLFTLGCAKPVDEPIPDPIKYGTASCDLNGEKWYGVVEPISQSTPNGNSRLNIFKSTAGQYIDFKGVKFEVGKNSLQDSYLTNSNYTYVGASLTTSSSDAVTHYLRLLSVDTIENFLEITAIDETEKTVKGKFQAIFGKFSIGDTLPYPIDTFYLLNGKFETNFN